MTLPTFDVSPFDKLPTRLNYMTGPLRYDYAIDYMFTKSLCIVYWTFLDNIKFKLCCKSSTFS